MTRRMLDALNPNNIPAGVVQAGDLLAAYLGHASNPASFDQAAARFPGHQIVSIASRNAVDAQVLDIESGAVEPTDYATINDWCVRQRARGVYPTLYMNTSTWPMVRPHLVGSVNWWAANWSGGPNIPAGAVGVQYSGGPGYDLSVMLDSIAGIDSGTNPSGGGTQEDDMPTAEEIAAAVWAHPVQASYGGYGEAAAGTYLGDARAAAGRVWIDPVSFPKWGTITAAQMLDEIRTYEPAIQSAADGDLEPLLDLIKALPAATVAALKEAL